MSTRHANSSDIKKNYVSRFKEGAEIGLKRALEITKNKMTDVGFDIKKQTRVLGKITDYVELRVKETDDLDENEIVNLAEAMAEDTGSKERYLEYGEVRGEMYGKRWAFSMIESNITEGELKGNIWRELDV